MLFNSRDLVSKSLQSLSYSFCVSYLSKAYLIPLIANVTHSEISNRQGVYLGSSVNFENDWSLSIYCKISVFSLGTFDKEKLASLDWKSSPFSNNNAFFLKSSHVNYSFGLSYKTWKMPVKTAINVSGIGSFILDMRSGLTLEQTSFILLVKLSKIAFFSASSLPLAVL